MKHQIEIKRDMSPEDMKTYSAYWPKHTPTGETLKETFPDGPGVTSQTLVVFNGPYTAYGMCRDCGDHYIIARYSRYDRIDKATLKITVDVEDC